MGLINLPRAPFHYDVRDQSELRRQIEFLAAQVNNLITATGTSSGGSSLTVDDEGVAQGVATTLDFVGAGVTASVAGSTATVTISGGGSGVDTDDEGVFIGTATTLDFVGGGVTATFGAGTTTVTVPGSTPLVATEIEILLADSDFPSVTGSVWDATYTDGIVDAAITPASSVLIWESGNAAAGEGTGDALMDTCHMTAVPKAGSADLYLRADPGPVGGSRKFVYVVF